MTSSVCSTPPFAELLGTAVLTQMVNPGTPVMLGLGGFGSDLATAGSGFGRPENALGTVLGAQLARRLGLPFRCSAMVTGARTPDARSGYEKMLTAFAAWQSGAHLALQGAGILDSINSMSFEQFLIDAEAWNCLKRLAAPTSTDPDYLAIDEILTVESDYLATDHTVAHMRREFFQPTLIAGGKDVVAIAAEKLAEMELTASALESDIEKGLTQYAIHRRDILSRRGQLIIAQE